MWEYARYLAFKGHSVTFVASSFPGARREEVVDGIKVVRLGGILSLWLKTFIYYMTHCRHRYDVVIVEGFGGSRIPRWAPLYVKEPIITEWHQVHRPLFAAQYPVLVRPFLNLLERITALIHRNTLLRAGTEEWRQAFTRIGFKKENIFVVPVSIREDWLQERGVKQISKPRLAWIGKFRRYKCPHHAVLAMRQVVKQIPEARLILVGRRDDRRYEQQLQHLIYEFGLERNVVFRFNISEEEKRELLKSCRAMVLPSSVEGFGIVVLEANAYGVPVIASSGVPEGVVRHGYNGLRYPFGDISALAESIIRILEDGELYTQLSANSLTFARRFGWRRIGAQFEEAVMQTVEDRRNKCETVQQ